VLTRLMTEHNMHRYLPSIRNMASRQLHY
jgi:hypothetical protein